MIQSIEAADESTEDATNPAEALKDVVGPAIRGLNERLEEVEKRVETGESKE